MEDAWEYETIEQREGLAKRQANTTGESTVVRSSSCLGNAPEDGENHSARSRAGGDEVVRLVFGNNLSKLDTVGYPQLLVLGQQRPEWFSPNGCTLREELADALTFFLHDQDTRRHRQYFSRYI